MMAEDDIVITGFSAYFPQANHLKEFKEKLYAGVDMVTDDESRWPRGFLGLPSRSGKIRDLSKCDVRFFTVHPELAQWTDPQVRLLLETSYEAIVDAGYDPATLRGRRIGVYIGVSASESADVGLMNPDRITGFLATGSSRTMASNLISYALDFHGPSVSLDTACSSTLTALHEAVLSIRAGICDAAIVGGSNLTLKPNVTLVYKRLGILSDDGACKVFDARANGYARSETVGVFFLQRASDARRIYAKVTNVGTNSDGYKSDGVGTPSGIMQEHLMRQVYSEAKIDPCDVGYVEAHGTGTLVGDATELAAIGNVFCPPRRQGSLKVGSVKSNVGHAEAASGICSVAKMILALETGTIAANLHFVEARPDIPALHDGRIEVVDKPTAITGGPIGISSFGVGGTNAHVILEAKDGPHVDSLPREKPELPRLVLMAGRSEDALKTTLNNLEAEGPYPDSGYALLNKVRPTNADLFRYRGYAILPVDGSGKEAIKKVDQAPFEKRPLWFVFAGMGCQWNGMARQMMQFDAFARSVYKSHDILKRVDVDLFDMLTEDMAKHQTSVSQLVSIAAVQVALVDTLRELGIEPDGFVGHSAGEVVCAYADGCFNIEQTLLSAYCRGRCLDEVNLPKGAMAAVGLTWEEAAKRCPDGVFPACHNAADSVTVSGDADAVARFVSELEADNVFARLLHGVHVAFHSPHVRGVGPALQEALETVIADPKPRSNRWITSSVPVDRWNEPFAKMCSAEYYVNNLVSPVLFRECLEFVPKDAILVEVAPHCLLQAVLMRAMGPRATCLGLMKRDAENVTFFLSALGRLHTLGFNIDVSVLYPTVSWPVPRGTPSIAHLVSWDHTDSYYVPSWQEFESTAQLSEEVVEVDLEANPQDKYLSGHMTNGHLVFPASGYMVMVWKSLARRRGRPFEETSVQFDDLVFHRPVMLPESGPLRFFVNIMHSSGEFDVCVNGTAAASGRVRLVEESGSLVGNESLLPFSETVSYDLDGEDFYKEALLRGYEYHGAFRAILKASTQKPCGKLKWEGNWVAFLDSMIHLSILVHPHRTMRLPFKIKSCRVDTNLHAQVAENSGDEGMEAVYWKRNRTSRSGGVDMRGIVVCVAPHRAIQQTPLLEECKFMPFFDDPDTVCRRAKHVREYVEVCSALTQSVIESCGKYHNVGDVVKGASLAPEHVLSLYLNKPADNHGVFQVLVAIRERVKGSECPLKEAVQEAMAAQKKLLEEDFLSTALFEEDPLRHLLDVVLENTPSKRIKVLEVVCEGSEYILTPRINSFLHKTGLSLKTEFVIGHSSPNFVLPDHSPEGARTIALDWSAEHGNDFHQSDLIVARLIPTSPICLHRMAAVLSSVCNEGSFALLALRTALTPAERFLSISGEQTHRVHVPEAVETVFGSRGFISVGLKSDGLTALMLLRKKSQGVHLSLQEVIRLNNNNFDWVQNVAQKAREHQKRSPGGNIWLVPKDGNTSGVVGLMKCLQEERTGKPFRCVFDASLTKSAEVMDFSPVNVAYKDLMQRDLAINVYRDGQWGSFSFLSTPLCATPKTTTQFAFLSPQARGNLSSFTWYESPLGHVFPRGRGSGSVLCSVYYAPINVGDIINVTGDIPEEDCERTSAKCVEELGWEFSGRDSAGRRVMGCLPGRGLATMVAACSDLLWEVPEAWSLKEASTVPMAYSTAYFALLVRGNLRPGETVLVQSGSSDVAQAAISIALSMGCCVFVVVDSNEERDFLKRGFPELKDSHLLSPDDRLFEEHIARYAMGSGVDVLISLPSGRHPQSGLNCLESRSRVLQILTPGEPQGVNADTLPSIRYRNMLEVSLEELLYNDDSQTKAEKRRVFELLQEGIVSGAVRPFEAVPFTPDQTDEAFRFMGNKDLFHKAVIEVRPEEPERNCVHVSPLNVEAVTRTYFYGHKSYVIIGGLGGFGLELADWMVTRGCRKLLLTSRSGVRTGYQRLSLHRWKLMGATVMVSSAEASTKGGAADVIDEATALGPIGGIFNLAAVFRDASIENQTPESFELVCKPKVDATHNLDDLSRKMCTELDHFVAFSSVSCGRGNEGQTNYGFANSVTERVCERRVADGLPGLAIQWGVVGDVGYAHDTYGADGDLGGFLPQRIASCMAVMDAFLNQGQPVMSSMVKDSPQQKPKKKNERDLVQTIAEMFGVKNPSEVNPAVTLGQLGLDSLMNVKVKQTVQRDCGLSLSAQEIRLLTFNRLREISQAAMPRSSAFS